MSNPCMSCGCDRYLPAPERCLHKANHRNYRARGLCLVCGREIQTLRDGTNRSHGQGGDCPGSGYRQARWPTGQLLRHHSGDLWEITDGCAPDMRYPNLPAAYDMRCVAGREKDREFRAHAEYLHRHGWTPALRSALGCPDGGYCGHGCEAACFRVQCCEPLSGIFPDDQWPVEIREAHSVLGLQEPRGDES